MNNESPLATHSGNGHAKVLWWILGGILGPMILAFANTVQTTANRVSVLETEFREIKHHLDAIETKLDRLVERK